MGFQIERLFILSTGGAINSQWQRKGHPSAHRNILGKTNFHYFSISSLLLPPPLSFSLSFSPLPPGKPDHPQPVSTQLPLIPAGIVSMAGLSRRVTYVLSSVRHHRNGICSSQKVLCPSHLFRNPSQHHCLLAESSLVAQPPIYLCCGRRHKRPSPRILHNRAVWLLLGLRGQRTTAEVETELGTRGRTKLAHWGRQPPCYFMVLS